MGRLYGLDALRGVAALMVAVSHFRAGVLGLDYLHGASLAVDFFFMLSGYIMARTYECRMPRDFVVLRFKRLWPAFAFGTVLGALILRENWAYLPLALLFLPLPLEKLFFFNPPAWSLFQELFANAAHSTLLAKARNAFLIATVAILLPFWAWAMWDGPTAAGMNIEQMPEAFLRVGVAYVMGIWLWRKFGDHPPIRIPAVVSVSLLLSVLVLPVEFSPAIVLLAMPVAILGGLSWNPGWLGKWAGALSYPLYITHAAVMMLPLPAWTIATLVVAATFAAHWVDGLRHRLFWGKAQPDRQPEVT